MECQKLNLQIGTGTETQITVNILIPFIHLNFIINNLIQTHIIALKANLLLSYKILKY